MPAMSILCVGDLQLGDSSIVTGFGIGSRIGGAQALTTALRRATDGVEAADVGLANLETVLSDAGLIHGSLRSEQMRGRPEFAQAVRDAGFDVVNFANNHCTQHGRRAFDETVAHLERAGVEACGIAGDPPWICDPLVRTAASGARVGFLSYSFRPRQWGEARVPYAEGHDDGIVEDVRRLRADADYVVVSLHWGEEFVAQPSEAEVELGHRIVDAGASLIAGHHPHVVRPVEIYGHGVIAYSLGNFVGDMFWDERFRRGLMARCSFRDGAAPEVSLFETRIGDDFGVTRRAIPPQEWPALAPLDATAYREAIDRTVGRQRRDSYAHLLRNVLRYRPGILGQLVATTLGNKLRGLVGSGT